MNEWMPSDEPSDQQKVHLQAKRFFVLQVEEKVNAW